MPPTDLEKTNLAVHVELDEFRQVAMLHDQQSQDQELVDLWDETKSIKEKINDVKDTFWKEINDLKESVEEVKEVRNQQIIKWGWAIIIALLTALGTIVVRVLIPLFMGK